MSFFNMYNNQKNILKPLRLAVCKAIALQSNCIAKTHFFYKKPVFVLLASTNYKQGVTRGSTTCAAFTVLAKSACWLCKASKVIYSKQVLRPVRSKYSATFAKQASHGRTQASLPVGCLLHTASQYKIGLTKSSPTRIKSLENHLYGVSSKKRGHTSLYSNSRFCKTLAMLPLQSKHKHRNWIEKRLVWEKSIEPRRKSLGVALQRQYSKPVSDTYFSPFFFFQQIFCPDLISRQNMKTHMQLSHVEKVSISYTQKTLVNSPTELVAPMAALELIAAQRCAVVWALKSVSSWKLRKNSVIGCKVTLRGKSAALFLEKLYTYVNLSEKNSCFVDKYGNMHFGVSENKCFHELQKYTSLWMGFSGFSISITKTPVLRMPKSTGFATSAL